MIELKLPVNNNILETLRYGDKVNISGVIYGARDAAHKKMYDIIKNNGQLPIEIKNQTIYYVGPCPAKPSEIIGSAGPTTSGRMDKYTPTLLDLGLKIMIGKGNRSTEVIESMQKNKAVYLAVIGGLGVLVKKSIISQEIVAFEELGTEAIRRYEINNLEAYVAIDIYGGNIYER